MHDVPGKGLSQPSERLEEIEDVVREVISRRLAGEQLADEEVERSHSKLLPELSCRLRTLRAIEAARAAARVGSRPESDRRDDCRVDEDIRFLQQELADYDILERIEYGGQGVVYKAVQRATHRCVAIKLLLDGPLATRRQLQRFDREVKLASRVRHENIVTIYESGSVRGRPYFAMEYVEGVPISDYLLLGEFSPSEIVSLFVTVCRAVSAAHQHGIIHRDLKPSNVLVDLEGIPHILDFGLAKDIYSSAEDEAATQVSFAGQVVGTLPYLSPEQVAAEEDVDIRSDVYTLGILLYQLLCGEFPYSVDGSREAVRLNILERQPRSLQRTFADLGRYHPGAHGVNDDLNAVLMKALEKDKNRRYQSVDAFAADLERYLRGDAVEVKSDRHWYLLRIALRRHKLGVAVAAAFVLVLISSLVGITIMWRRAERIAAIAQQELQAVAYTRLGGGAVHANRDDDAIALNEKVIKIAELMPSDNLVVLHQHIAAYQQICGIRLSRGDVDRAAEYCDAAERMAREAVDDYPDDVEWQQILVGSMELRGRQAYAMGDYEAAIEHFAYTLSERNKLLAIMPDNGFVLDAKAISLHWRGKCYCALGQLEECLSDRLAAREVYTELCETSPEGNDCLIDSLRADLAVAATYMRFRTKEYDEIAKDALDHILRTLDEIGVVQHRIGDISNIRGATQKNLEIIEKRSL